MNSFKDLFSKQASTYRNSRPTYPDALYEFVVSHCERKDLAWDCATGNGQCAVSLARYFDKIIATDASESQIWNAVPNPKVDYYVRTAYNSSLENASADLITVATAAHWFEIEKFYTEVDRVLKPGGILAIWSYGGCRVNEEIDKVIAKLSYEILGDYWAPEIWQIWRDKYRNLPFPYPQIETPLFQSKLQWNYEQIINYFHSWSGVQNYKDKTGEDPVTLIENELQQVWGDTDSEKTVIWDLYMKIGKKP